MNTKKSSYDNFAKEYSESMGDIGDEVHQTQIDPYVYKIIGDPKEKVICDLGCGNGYMSRYLAKNNAKVFASDISESLLEIAKAKSTGLDINFAMHSADDLSRYKSEFFDVVVMNMSIHYIDNLDNLFKGIARVLKDGGVLVFSTNHFFRPNGPYSEWVKGMVGGEERLFIKVTDYLTRRENKIMSGWDKKTILSIHNNTLNGLVNGMSKHGLLTFSVFEPEPVNSGQAYSEELQKSHHIPTFIIFGAKKYKGD
jgi:2-polyprenyl-3-methyl-5-hydroxy-6-metoxy-1,4-benzoquinol methylase